MAIVWLVAVVHDSLAACASAVPAIFRNPALPCLKIASFLFEEEKKTYGAIIAHAKNFP